jgi:hypothetical protein
MNTKKFDLIGELRATFPEIENRYQEEIRSWQGKMPGDSNVVAFVLKPFLRTELEKGIVSDFLLRLAKFMEDVFASGDIDAINVIWLKLFKLLLAQPADLNRIWPFLGPETRLNLEDAASRWDMRRNLPVRK